MIFRQALHAAHSVSGGEVHARQPRMNIVTLREDPSDAEIVSHRLLLRAGFIYKSALVCISGPLLQRVIHKIKGWFATRLL